VKSDFSTVSHDLATEPPTESFEVFGGVVEFLSWSEEFCVMRGTVAPGAVVALHRHSDAEDFFILSGSQQVLVQKEAGGLEWRDAHAGDYIRVPGDVLHAWRNVTDEPAVDLIVTTARLGRFFAEVGRPVTDTLGPPTPEEVANFVAVSEKYGYVLGTPAENAAVGITLPMFTSTDG
jgi:quercetin dioxygenase-like cupin family protein